MNKTLRKFLEEAANILIILLEYPSILWFILAMWLVYMLTPTILSLAGVI